MRLPKLKFAAIFLLPCLWPLAARAVSCTTQSEMNAAQRSAYERAARSFASQIESGNTAAIRAETVSAVAAHFDPLAATIGQASPLIQKATLTVDDLYSLDATDLQPGGGQQAQFFCGLAGSSLLVTVSIPQLPAGDYLLALVHATGVEQPQQISLLLQKEPPGSSQWKLAGLFIRPLTVAGHDGVWYWRKARAFAALKQNLNAYFYYETAEYLLTPVQFLTSPNLQKLQKEAKSSRPAELPGQQPLVISAGGEDLEITHLRTDAFSGALDLVVDYKAKNVSGPVATREQIVALMKALLAKYPQLRGGFHGLWVYAYDSNGQPFAIELPMNQIQ